MRESKISHAVPDQPDLKPSQNTGSNLQFAAIDLGSNSFHMIIAEPEGNSIRVIDSLKESVRLGSGLDNQKRIKPATEKLALKTIGQFAQRLREIPSENIRIVGTNTLRRAKNVERFIQACYQRLPKRIEIISGREEARLIYSAVAHGLPDPDKQRLVIDIGGGSTELIIGRGFSPMIMESVNMGCVSYTQRFFADGNLRSSSIKDCLISAQLELQPLVQAYRDAHWDEAIGCSGTIKAASRVLEELQLTDGTITRGALKQLQNHFIKCGSIDKLSFSSITPDRIKVFVAGVLILFAVMRILRIHKLQASQVALREGLIFELIGQMEHHDIQAQTIANLVSRYHVDTAQADRVERTAVELFDAAKDAWKLADPTDRDMLRWSSAIHEIGLSVSHSQYHKHGFYLINNSDLLGFSKSEQSVLALLVRYHRRKIDAEAFSEFNPEERDRLNKLQILLRLAVLLHRARHAESLQALRFTFAEDEIAVHAPNYWYHAHPLTSADLQQEADHLDRIGVSLSMVRTA